MGYESLKSLEDGYRIINSTENPAHLTLKTPTTQPKQAIYKPLQSPETRNVPNMKQNARQPQL